MCLAVVDNGREAIGRTRADESRVDTLQHEKTPSQTRVLGSGDVALPPGSVTPGPQSMILYFNCVQPSRNDFRGRRGTH